jgi:1-acyl-sn-glycerol-3-phosphate acyltransferase
MPDRLSYLWYEMWYGLTFAGMTLAFSLRIEGARHIPLRGPVLLIANHQSYLDPLAVGLASRRHVYFLARKGLFRNRVFGSYLRSVNCVPVDQEGVAKEGIKTALKLLRDGRVVVIFPEGERTHTGQMQPLRPGIHLLIKRAGAAIVPVGMAGAYQAYPRSRLLPRLSPLFLPANGCAVAACVGPALPAKLYADMPREQALADLFGRLQAVQQRAEHLRRKS